MFIRWLLKVGLGINLQSTIGISVRSKAPRLLPTAHSPLFLNLPFIWNQRSLRSSYYQSPPSSTAFYKAVLQEIIPKKSMYLAYQYL